MMELDVFVPAYSDNNTVFGIIGPAGSMSKDSIVKI
jgi:hypothetical protein